MNRSPLRGECTVIAAPGAQASPTLSASRLVSAAQLFGAAVMAAPGMLEEIVASQGEVRDTMLGLLDCLNDYEALMARPPVKRTG